MSAGGPTRKVSGTHRVSDRYLPINIKYTQWLLLFINFFVDRRLDYLFIQDKKKTNKILT